MAAEHSTPGNKKVAKNTVKTPGSGQKNAGQNTPKQNVKSPGEGKRKRKSSVLNTPQQNVSPTKGANKQNTPTPKKNGVTPKQKTPTPNKKTKKQPIKAEVEDSESEDDVEEDDIKMESDESDEESNDLIEAKSEEENDSEENDVEDEPESPKKLKLDSEAEKRKVSKAQKLADAEEKKLKRAKIIEENRLSKDRTIFVGNIGIETKEEQLQAHFKKFGKIISITIKSVPVANPKNTKKKELPFKTTSAFIRFDTREEALKALVENGNLLNDTHIRVSMCDKEERSEENKSIFVGNVSFEAEDEDFWKTFESCGEIESVRIPRDKNTKKAKGFGYVNFVSADSVKTALQMEKVKLHNREIRISAYTAKEGRKNEGKGNVARDMKHKNRNKNKGGPDEKKNYQKKFNKKNKKQNSPKTEGGTPVKSPKATGFQGSKFAQKKKNKINK